MSVPTGVGMMGPSTLQVPKRQSAERPLAHCCALDGGGAVVVSLQAVNMAVAVAAIARDAKILNLIVSSFL